MACSVYLWWRAGAEIGDTHRFEWVRVPDWEGRLGYINAKARYSIRATWARNRLARMNTRGKLVPIR